jgi:23S rRNA (pseudouridine1915-N3)-methyltransferase
LKITVLTVGHLKERYWRDAVSEYSKRLGRYVGLDTVEVDDEKTPDKYSADTETVLKREAERLEHHIRKGTYLITLEIKGKQTDSVSFADHIQKCQTNGISDITFVIGGSLGLHKSITDRSDYHLSFSEMTFPHQLMRVILLEQIYRCYRIINNEPYHK